MPPAGRVQPVPCHDGVRPVNGTITYRRPRGILFPVARRRRRTVTRPADRHPVRTRQRTVQGGRGRTTRSGSVCKPSGPASTHRGAMPETDAAMDSLDYTRLSFRRNLSVEPALWRDWRATADVSGDVSALVLVSGPPGAGPCVECGETRLLEQMPTIVSPYETAEHQRARTPRTWCGRLLRRLPHDYRWRFQRVREADMAEPEAHVTLVYSPQFGRRSWWQRLTDRRKETPADDLYRLLIQVVAKSLAQREVVVEVKARVTT